MADNKWCLVEDKLKSIEKWAMQGLSEKQISKNIGIAYSTFRKYKKDHLALSDTLKRGKEVIDLEVENSLLKRALGYNTLEKQAIKTKKIFWDEEGRKCSKEQIEIVQIEKHIPADVSAQKFWLVNRQKDKWKDNPHKVTNDREVLKLRKKELENKTW